MEKLMKPAEYAKELGISRQAVYAKIKRGILKSKNVEGKLYIVLDTTETTISTQSKTTSSAYMKSTQTAKDYKSLLESKDETISVLKSTVKDLKKSNKQISQTLKGEIDLLKEAFHEMRSLYVLQLEAQKPVNKNLTLEEVIEVEDEVSNIQWVGLKKFYKQYDIRKEKQQEKIYKRLHKAFKKNDTRFTKRKGKLKLNADASYEDIFM